MNKLIQPAFFSFIIASFLFIPASAAPGNTPPLGNVDANFNSVAAGSARIGLLEINDKGNLLSTNASPVVVISDGGFQIADGASNVNFAISQAGEISSTGSVKIKDDDGLSVQNTAGTVEALKIDSSGNINNSTAQPVNITDEQGLSIQSSTAALNVKNGSGSTMASIDASNGNFSSNGNITISGHLRATGGVGTYVTTTLNSASTVAGSTASITVSCPGSYKAISCGFSSNPAGSLWDFRSMYPTASSCVVTARNAGSVNQTLTGYVNCFDPNG